MLKALLLMLLIAATGPAYAQVTQAQLDAIAQATPEQIDEAMRASAELAASNMPMQIDSITTATGAVYLKQARTFIYYGELATVLSEQEQWEHAHLGQVRFCNSAMNRAWTARGVTYQYIFDTPAGRFSYSFNRSSCS